MGYNWLESNEKSGIKTAERIRKLIAKYQQQGYQCEKVIVITHSMGGLVARAMAHPQMGNLQNRILGIVHGVMPAIGAAATYKRMRCGFEGVAGNVLGRDGPSVTAVLANAQGGLELLPSSAYGNGWLTVTYKTNTLLDLPGQRNPYDEIYKVRDRWYQLIIEDWINPATEIGPGLDVTFGYLDRARKFHEKLDGYYHPQSYAHYGADPHRQAWRSVCWKVQGAQFNSVHEATIVNDTAQGSLWLLDPYAPTVVGRAVTHNWVSLQPPNDPGDETVPAFSADDQLRSGKLKGVFRQTGYEHQGSYKNEAALFSTLYSIVKIAETMTWTK